MAKSTQPDPIVNRPEQQQQYEFDPAKLKNADVNISKYGDDSSAQNYNNPELWWGQNQKYTWANTKNTEVAYNKDATIEGLDPNYLYGQQAQMKNSEEEGYIMRRNDNIASALYNEGKVSKQDVSDFLYGQSWFTNSNINERQNTIDSVYKRLGQIGEKNQQNEGKNQEQTNTQQNNPEMKLDDDGTRTSTLYGKVSTDSATPVEWIKGETDPNAIQNTINMSRQNNFKNLQKMSSYDIAVSIAYGTDPYGSQAMADLAQFAPQKYQEIQQEIKNIQSMEDVNNIAQGGNVDKTGQNEMITETINSWADQWLDRVSTNEDRETIKSDLQTAMASNQTAQTATQEMLNLNKDMAEIQEKMNKLPQEAKKAFKWDVPQYIVDAFIANRSAQYQSELSKLQSRYNSAVDLYKTELSNEQRKQEFALKQIQVQADLNNQAWERNYKTTQLWLDQQRLNLSKIQWYQGKAFQVNNDGTVTQLTMTPGMTQYDLLRNEASSSMQQYLSVINDDEIWGSCEHFTNQGNMAIYWMRMQWTGPGGATYAQEKVDYVNVAAELPGVWMTAVFDYRDWSMNVSGDAMKYWHTMFVAWYDPATGMLTLKWSNGNRTNLKDKVYTRTRSISEWKAMWLKWYWDPIQDMQIQWAWEAPIFNVANTPMLETFDNLYTSDLNASQKQSLSQWENMYNILYNMKETGLVDALVSSSWWEKVMADLDSKKFTEDDNGSAFFDAFTKSIRNNIAGDEATIAVNKFQVLVKDLLRFESGAAISSTEWRSYFQLYMPKAWESEEVQKSKLNNWDAEVYKLLRSAWLPSRDYIPIFQDYSLGTGWGTWWNPRA